MSSEMSPNEKELFAILEKLHDDEKTILAMVMDHDINEFLSGEQSKFGPRVKEMLRRPGLPTVDGLKYFIEDMNNPTYKKLNEQRVAAILNIAPELTDAWKRLKKECGIPVGVETDEFPMVQRRERDTNPSETKSIETDRLRVAYKVEGGKHSNGSTESQDTAYVSEDGTMGVIADGMGGSAGGKEASTLTAEVFTQISEEIQGETGVQEKIEEVFRVGIDDTVEVVQNRAQGNDELKKMGTTLTAYKIYTEGNEEKITIAHVGDSSLFAITDTGELERLTELQGLAWSMQHDSEDPEIYLQQLTQFIDDYDGRTDIPTWIKNNIPQLHPDVIGDAPIIWDGRHKIGNAIHAAGGVQSTVITKIIKANWVGFLDASDCLFDGATLQEIETIIREETKNGATEAQVVDALHKRARDVFANVGRNKGYPDDFSAIFTKIKR